MADPKVLEKLVADLRAKTKKEKPSLLFKHLTDSSIEQLVKCKTKLGGTLIHCIQSGCKNPDSGVGIYAPDPEGYDTFALVLDGVIKEYHKVPEVTHPACDFGLDEVMKWEDLEEGLIVSTRVRVGRSHAEYGFPPILTKDDRINMEKKTVEALSKLTGDHQGTYYPLTGMSKETEQQLIDDHFLFKNDDRFLEAADGYADWPTGRGIFHNAAKTFLVWVNEEDHIRIISMQMGGDLKQVYKRLVEGIQTLQETLTFARNDRLGFLTFCPSNLGTALRASVHIKIPNLSANKAEFDKICEEYKLQPRGIHGEHTESKGGVFDISNKRRLGLTEFQAIKEMYDGVKAIIKKEKELAGKKA